MPPVRSCLLLRRLARLHLENFRFMTTFTLQVLFFGVVLMAGRDTRDISRGGQSQSLRELYLCQERLRHREEVNQHPSQHHSHRIGTFSTCCGFLHPASSSLLIPHADFRKGIKQDSPTPAHQPLLLSSLAVVRGQAFGVRFNKGVFRAKTGGSILQQAICLAKADEAKKGHITGLALPR